MKKYGYKMQNINVLMCVGVVSLLDSIQQAYLRCAGTTGFAAYEELISLLVDGATSSSVMAIVKVDKIQPPPCRHRWVGIVEKEVDKPSPCRGEEEEEEDMGVDLLPLPMHPPVSPRTHTYPKSPLPYRSTITIFDEAVQRRKQNISLWSSSDRIDNIVDPLRRWKGHNLPTIRVVYAIEPPSDYSSSPPTILNFKVNGNLKEVVLRRSHSSAHDEHTDVHVELAECLTLKCNEWMTTFKIMSESSTSTSRGFNTAQYTSANTEKKGGDIIISKIPDYFIYSCSQVHTIHLPALQHVTVVGDMFLAYCKALVAFDFTPLHNVVTVGMHFCVGTSLINVDISMLKQLRDVGNGFFMQCRQLQTVSLPNLRFNDSTSSPSTTTDTAITSSTTTASSSSSSAAHGDGYGLLSPTHSTSPSQRRNLPCCGCSGISIGNKFFADCDTLRCIDFESLCCVSCIGVVEGMFSRCPSLTSLNLSPLKRFLNIGNLFLSGGCGISLTLDVTPLSNVTVIGNAFMGSDTTPLGSQGSKTITELDLSSLVNITSIGDAFCKDCTELKTVTLPQLKSGEVTIGSEFFYRCCSLEAIDLVPLGRITRFQESMLAGCSRLKTVNLTPFSECSVIAPSFLSGCGRLEGGIDFGPLRNVTAIGEHFCSRCYFAKSVDLSPLLPKFPNAVTRFHYLLNREFHGDWSDPCDPRHYSDASPLVQQQRRQQQEKKVYFSNTRRRLGVLKGRLKNFFSKK